ncbi:MAG: Hsp70 family protein [Polyangiaceae bacterium]
MTLAFGIDLGTTHTALASANVTDESPPKVEPVTQLVARNEVDARPLLPSFLYFASDGEDALALPWATERRFCVGAHARARAVEAPDRVVSSAKSWLCHPGIDRRAAALPANAADDIEAISPVEASFRFLDHLAEALQARPGPSLAEHPVILTVPASFDAAARDLTVEAAYAAGLDQLTLLEEPQAALYAWLAAHQANFRDHLRPDDVVLVIDIGGGTTDFSAIRCVERNGELELERVAVGDHILLGGDNMDLTLAHVALQRARGGGGTQDRLQLASLAHACRNAKERLFAEPELQSVPVAVAGRGSALMGNVVRSEVTRADVESSLIQGFFPRVDAAAQPAQRARTGLTRLGLPYASDPAITKHLAAFLCKNAELGSSSTLLRPTAVLFNGGVVKAQAVRDCIVQTLNGWLERDGAPALRVLPGDDPELAVARGAAFYARVRAGKGLRIRGGTARAYYIGIESPAPAVPGLEPPMIAMCVSPFGMEEGTHAELPAHELGVIVGEPVQFRFFGSTARRHDAAGATLESWSDAELQELSPLEVTLPAEGREAGDVVPVHLEAQVTPVGTLLLEAVPFEPKQADERWKVELGVRSHDSD